MKRFARIALGLAGVASLAADAQATVVRSMTNRELAEQAEVIVVGRCVAVSSAWEGRTLVTLATIEVSESLKGDATGTITVALPGGADANRRFPIAMTYAGAPQIRAQEEVFLFLGQDAEVASGLTVLGFAQGKFSIVTEPNGRRSVSRDLTNLVLQGGAGVVTGSVSLTSLSEFRDEVASYLR